MGILDKIDSKRKEKWGAEITAAHAKSNNPTDPTDQESAVLYFKSFKQWQALYDPDAVKQVKEPKDRDPEDDEKKGTGKVARFVITKILGKVNENMKENITLKLYEIIARLADLATESIRRKEINVARFLNSVEALVLTYRYENKHAEKFKFFRELALDHIAISIHDIMAEFEDSRVIVDKIEEKICTAECKGEEITKHSGEELALVKGGDADEILEFVFKKIYPAIQSKREELMKRVQDQPLVSFARSHDLQGGVDPGILQLVEVLQGTFETRIAAILEDLKGILRDLITTVVASRNGLRSELTNARDKVPCEHKSGLSGGRGQLTSGLESVRDQLCVKTSHCRGQLEDGIGRYVDHFTEMLSSLMIHEGDEEVKEPYYQSPRN